MKDMFDSHGQVLDWSVWVSQLPGSHRRAIENVCGNFGDADAK